MQSQQPADLSRVRESVLQSLHKKQGSQSIDFKLLTNLFAVYCLQSVIVLQPRNDEEQL